MLALISAVADLAEVLTYLVVSECDALCIFVAFCVNSAVDIKGVYILVEAVCELIYCLVVSVTAFGNGSLKSLLDLFDCYRLVAAVSHLLEVYCAAVCNGKLRHIVEEDLVLAAV